MNSPGAMLVPMVQSWSEIRADIDLNWFIYLSMPLVAAFVGYTTKLVALWMLYYPIEPKGIGKLTWQGIVPSRAGKMAAMTMEQLTGKLLDPVELLDQVDGAKAVEALRGPLAHAADEMVRDLLEVVRPGLWDSLPEAGRKVVHARVLAAAPRMVDNLVTEMKTDLHLYVDMQYLAVTTLVRNKAQLNDLMKGMAGRPQQFIRRSGIYFGFAIGLVQMVAWGVFHNPWIMPAFGFFTGFASDWLALNLLFIPRHPKRILGIKVQGVIPSVREEVSLNYARIMARDIFAPDAMLEAILHGPTADRLLGLVAREVSQAIDDQAGPLTPLAIGAQRYQRLRDALVARVMQRINEYADGIDGFEDAADQAEALLREKMLALTVEEFEGMMRPIFKDDELLMVMVGAVLGFGVGELQVYLVEHLSR